MHAYKYDKVIMVYNVEFLLEKGLFVYYCLGMFSVRTVANISI